MKSRVLRTEEEIRAAGAAAAADAPPLSESQVELIVALLSPVRDQVWRRLDLPTSPTLKNGAAA